MILVGFKTLPLKGDEIMKIFIIFWGIIFLAVTSGLATTIQVPGDYNTIQAGMDAAENGDTVLVANGIYTGFGNKDLDYHGKAIAVISEHGPEATIIDCEDAGRGFYFHSGEGPGSRLEGFTIRHGYPYLDDGGGIKCSNSSPSITNCIISRNSAEQGGGIYCQNSSLTLTSCRIDDNYALDRYGGGICYDGDNNALLTDCVISGNTTPLHGGGIYCYWFSSVFITGCTISGNTSYEGGGIDCRYATVTLSDCSITNNRVEGGYGGGINGYQFFTLRITNCAISENTAQGGPGGSGAGVFANQPCTIANCIISGNTASNDGGGIYCFLFSSSTITGCAISGNIAGSVGGGIGISGDRPTVNNCIISNNRAGTSGGGIGPATVTNCTIFGNTANVSGGGIIGSGIVKNCIVWNNQPDEIYSSSSKPTVTYSDVEGGWAGVGNIDVDPYFRDSDNGDFHLMATYCEDEYDSPCIDKGDPTILDSLLDCFHGLGANRSDMGAYGGDNADWPTAVGQDEERGRSPIPSSFSLYQNYPNPFNSQTFLRYDLLKSGQITVSIYNVLGQRVATLYEGHQEVGEHKVVWKANDCSTGIYFAKLKFNDHSKTIKMILLK
jgi:parallel beta-helix repeat protein/predicted outer membrane repeat protein